MELGSELVQRALAHEEGSPDEGELAPRLRATLDVLRAATLASDGLVPAIRAALEAGVSREALDDAIHICGAFNIITRVADTVDFAVPREPELSKHARFVYKRGYGR